MATGYNRSPFVLPQMFQPPGQALDNALDRQMRQDELNYRREYQQQKDKENDEWKKLNLIQELTNIDKYNTGEAVADAIGHQKAQDIFGKYTALAGSLSPAELQYRIAQDIGKTTLGMQGMKDELVRSDAQIAQLQKLYPTIDAQRLTKELRNEVLGRRIEGNEFSNPLKANVPSTFKLDDPDFLSYFLRDSKGLTEAIRNPKNVEDVQVGMGSPSSYTMMKGKLNPFNELTYDPTADVKDGFLKKGVQPGMRVIQGKEKLKGADVDVLGEKPFALLEETSRLELAREARQKFPDYDLMSNAEKQTARRSAALDMVKSIDKSGFDFGSATKPPSIRVSTGGSSSGDANVNDVYNSIDEALKEQEGKGSRWLSVSVLNPDAKEVVMKAAKLENEDLVAEDLQVIRGTDGTLRVFADGGQTFVNYVPRKATNIGKQPSVKEKRVVVEKGDVPKTTPSKLQNTNAEDLRKKYNY